MEINIPKPEALGASLQMITVQVNARPNELPRLTWFDAHGAAWRIPHNGRRRRIILPRYDVLVAQGVPGEVATGLAQKTVSVNFHPGSLCCLPDQYRFPDYTGKKWPVRIEDCVLVGYGEEKEYRA
jgi:hypothetical protein